jgi:putative transposase
MRDDSLIPHFGWTRIVLLKQEHPSWGAPKIGERLRRKHSDLQCPAISTVHAILDRHGAW